MLFLSSERGKDRQLRELTNDHRREEQETVSSITATSTIEAPLEEVFETVADAEGFARAIPEILEVEFLSETRGGVGTRFRETRLTTPLLKGMIAKAILADMDSVKAYCEG
jgi:hypothetical protein